MDRKTLFGVIVVAIVGLLLFSIATPNLLRSREVANMAMEKYKTRTFLASFGTPVDAQKAEADPSRKVIRKVSLQLVVGNVGTTSSDLRRIAEHFGGVVDHVRLAEASDSYGSAELMLRVPAAELETVLAEFKKLAVKVSQEEINATDVTHQWADNDARLRNMKAEEAQYLEIMKRAGTIKDTLEVTEKLSDVRGRIEELQAEINVMSHDVEMSSVAIVLVPQPPRTGLLAEWHPLLSVHSYFSSMLGGITSWVDMIAGLLILLPAILLWGGSIAAGGYACYWILRFLVRKTVKPAAAEAK